MNVILLRRTSLALSGLTFLAIALFATVAPRSAAQAYAILPDGVSGMSEFRAIFSGFWFALAAMMITAARRPAERLLGDLCGAFLLLQASGRALSFALDGVPAPQFVAAFAAELAAGLVVLLARPATMKEARDAQPA